MLTDNDGDLDLVINNLNAPATLYKNNSEQSTENHFINFSCIGNKDNPNGIGTTFTVYTASLTQVVSIMPVRGYYSAVDPRAHFGLGKLTQVDSIRIQWPDGKIQVIGNTKADQPDATPPSLAGLTLPRVSPQSSNTPF